jgi:hypothetical protein
MATATAKPKKTRIFYTVQEVSTRPWSDPVGGNRVWTLQQAKRISSILRKQRRKCFLVQIRLFV